MESDSACARPVTSGINKDKRLLGRGEWAKKSNAFHVGFVVEDIDRTQKCSAFRQRREY